MDWSDVLARVEAGEDSLTEFKLGLGDMSVVGKAICGFANAEGGLVVLGVTDDGQIVGVREDAETARERLTSFLQTGCSSPVSAHLGLQQDSQTRVLWIDVARQRGFEPMRYGGRVWTRRERSTVEPSPMELQELYNTFGYILTEERSIQDAHATHIDLEAFRSFLDRLGFDTKMDPQPSSDDDLRNRGVLTHVGGELRATLYGVLAFGRDPQRYAQTRNFRIECASYAGCDRSSDVLQVSKANGRLDEQVERAVGWFLGLGRHESYQELQRTDRYLLPRSAIREAIVNAVTHRDYAITGSKVMLEVFEDRVDVTSPGALPNHMLVENVLAGAHPRSRNESMAHFMEGMGLMEQRGRGWLIMRREMMAFNGTEPELLEDQRSKYVRVRFRLDRHLKADSTPVDPK